MLRVILLVLILLNLGLWAWSRPDVTAWRLGGQLEAGHDPARTNTQVRPDAVRLLDRAEVRALLVQAPPPASAAPASAPAPDNGDLLCLQSPALDDDEYESATTRLHQVGLSSVDWVDVRREFPGRWGVVIGRLGGREQLKRKSDELRRMGIDFEPLPDSSDLSPGLLLGGEFPTEADAKSRLAQLSAKGVRSARLAVLKPSAVEHRLRIDALTAPQAAKVRNATPDTAWQRCAD